MDKPCTSCSQSGPCRRSRRLSGSGSAAAFPAHWAHRRGAKGGGRVLSQFCRKCKGNYAGYIENMWHSHVVKSAFLSGILSHFALTLSQKRGILESRTFPSQESSM